MNKFHSLKQMRFNGDSILTLKGKDAILATIDFSEKYIKAKRHSRFNMEKYSITVFSWTEDKFRNIDVKDIMHINPLSNVLKNKSPEIIADEF